MIGPRLASATFADTRGPIELRVEDRLESIAIPIRDMSAAMIAILVGSVALHVLLVAMTFATGRAPAPVVPREISVEVVQDTPKPPPATKPPAPAQQQAAAPKPEPAKLEAPKAEAPKPTPAAAEAKPPTPVAPKPTVQNKPVAPPLKPAPADDAKAAQEAKLNEAKALETELANLRAEQAALKTSEANAADEAAGRAGSGQAIAMPSIGGDGDGVGYQQLVFSQLAKAKGDLEYHGKSGVAGIRFEMDQAGQLVHAEVVTPSGDAALDAKALDIIHRAAPFPAPPTEADRIVFANVNFIAPKPQ